MPGEFCLSHVKVPTSYLQLSTYLDVGDDSLQVVLHPLEQLLSIALPGSLSEHLSLQPILLELEVGNGQVQTRVGLVVPSRETGSEAQQSGCSHR